ncbi:putative DNA-binding helix-hairpin-helix protein [Sinorhizobium meliloti]|nr:putative DNA-binding helix-hairpin-helix protein [Sinorhizobium meliloti]
MIGYEVVEDMQHLPTAELLRIPGMGGNDWRKIAKALGRDPFPTLKKRP